MLCQMLHYPFVRLKGFRANVAREIHRVRAALLFHFVIVAVLFHRFVIGLASWPVVNPFQALRGELRKPLEGIGGPADVNLRAVGQALVALEFVLVPEREESVGLNPCSGVVITTTDICIYFKLKK